MPADAPQAASSAPSPRGLIPPHLVVREFLAPASAAGLLDYALSRQADFTPTGVGAKKRDPGMRVSLGLRDLGPFREVLEREIFARLPDLTAQLRVAPVEAPSLETDLVAHGDGGFFKRHIDTHTANYAEADRVRILSGVYYFHADPKRFSGGALRLHAVGGPGGGFLDIEPEHDSLVFFLAWAPHEVMPVSCASGRFRDSRFSVNCWVHGNKRRSPAPPRSCIRPSTG
jgi:Rps23 Pro-64 3,4-dihydroxylase Tpa1-like proline 4-hydroxylase